MPKDFQHLEKHAKSMKLHLLGMAMDREALAFTRGEMPSPEEVHVETKLKEYYARTHSQAKHLNIEEPEQAEKRVRRALDHFKDFLNSPEEDSLTLHETSALLRDLVDLEANKNRKESLKEEEEELQRKKIFTSTQETLDHIKKKELLGVSKSIQELLEEYITGTMDTSPAFEMLNHSMDHLTPKGRKKVKKFLKEAEIDCHGKYWE